MSILSSKTERRALKVIANTLRFFDHTDLLLMSAEDAQKARQAENTLRSIIENNGYTTRYKKGRGTKMYKNRKNKQSHENELF